MIRSWLAATVGTLFIAGSSTGAALQHNEQRPNPERTGTSTRQIQAVDVACVQAAISARELALSSAATTQSQAVIAAYAARASALSAAYTGTDPKVIKKNVKSAWEAFSTATKNAKKTWQRGRENTWNTFRTAVKACKGGESVSDSTNASVEQQ